MIAKLCNGPGRRTRAAMNLQRRHHHQEVVAEVVSQNAMLAPGKNVLVAGVWTTATMANAMPETEAMDLM